MAAQWSHELQKSAVVAQAVSALGEPAGRRPLAGGELRQLRRELEQMAQRARARQRELKQQAGQHALSAGAAQAQRQAADAAAAAAQDAKPLAAAAAAAVPAGKRARRTGASDSEQSPGEAMGPPATPSRARHSAGTPVQDDFSRVRVTNQVQIQTFWASLDAYFRALADDDIAFLEQQPPPPPARAGDAYEVPRLGRFYAHRWAEEEVGHFPELVQNARSKHMARGLLAEAGASSAAAGAEGRAPLTERVIAALVAERIVHAAGGEPAGGEAEGGAEGGAEGAAAAAAPAGDAAGLEERLKRELRYIGILDDCDVDWAERQDDEVSAALRHLQRQLRAQAELNAQRRTRLLPVAREHLGQQEYVQVVDELDKQVEQCYLKRHRLTKSRKRKSHAVSAAAAAAPRSAGLSENALNAMDRRRRVIDAIGHLFPPDRFDLPTARLFTATAPNPDLDLR
ncbi:Transcriptional regulator [Coemansia erecta]|uniref:Transcriptional regulator n=1 Tax=Coemansia erecta TaxID=147472 RepID=A0A9W8CPX2_9FUNG|nr:Transcriptional regulator [Coemansia erecta]